MSSAGGVRLWARALRVVLVPKTRGSAGLWPATLLALGVPFAATATGLGRAADFVLHRHATRRPLCEPVFIVGHPRTGTTWLQHLLALDSERFYSARTWELAVPAASAHRLIERAARVDARIGGALARLVAASDRRLFGRIRPTHRTGWLAHEEDEGMFVHGFATARLLHIVPAPALFEGLWFADRLPAPDRAHRMRRYRSHIQRLLAAGGGGRQLLSKNPLLSGWLRPLREEFPDARFLWVDRPAEHCIPSLLELIFQSWRLVDGSIQRTGPEIRALAALCAELYRRVPADLEDAPADRVHRLDFDRLASNPEAAIASIYRRFQWEMGDAFRSRLAAASARSARCLPRTGLPKLRHFGLSLADLGLDGRGSRSGLESGAIPSRSLS